MEPAREARAPKQDADEVDAIQATGHPAHRNRATCSPTEDRVWVGVRELLDRVLAEAEAGAGADNNTSTKCSVKEEIPCQDLIEQVPWGPVP